MSSQEVSHARTYPSPAKVQESAGSDPAYGKPCSTPFAQFDPNTYSLRTFQLSLFEDSMSSSLTLPRAGSMRNGECFERQTSVPRTVVNGSTSWPTARASMGAGGVAWVRAESGDHRSQLEDYLAWQYLKSGGVRTRGLNVNPAWLDWFMGFPDRWTDLEG